MTQRICQDDSKRSSQIPVFRRPNMTAYETPQTAAAEPPVRERGPCPNPQRKSNQPVQQQPAQPKQATPSKQGPCPNPQPGTKGRQRPPTQSQLSTPQAGITRIPRFQPCPDSAKTTPSQPTFGTPSRIPGRQPPPPRSRTAPFVSDNPLLKPKPCPGINTPLAEGADILQVAPVPNMQPYARVPAVTVEVVPLDESRLTPGQPIPAPTPDEVKIAKKLRRAHKQEERAQQMQAASENIIPIDYEAPLVDNTTLDNGVMLSYIENENWDRIVNQQAIILGDESLPPGYAGYTDDENDDDYHDNSTAWESLVGRAQGANLENVTPQIQSFCTDDPSRLYK